MSTLYVDNIESESNTFVNINPSYYEGQVLQIRMAQYRAPNTAVLSTSGARIFTGPYFYAKAKGKSMFKIDVSITGEFSDAGQVYNSMAYLRRRYQSNSKGGTVETELGASDAGSRTWGIAPPALSYEGTDDASTLESINFTYFDFPDNAPYLIWGRLAYDPYIRVSTGTPTFYLNRTVTDTDNNQYERGTSTISVTEIYVGDEGANSVYWGGDLFLGGEGDNT